jgi:hypothetical protein
MVVFSSVAHVLKTQTHTQEQIEQNKQKQTTQGQSSHPYANMANQHTG